MTTSKKLISTGIKGLDDILNGGLITEDAYLVRGGPGTGKTTLGLHFLEEGINNNEDILFVTLSEPKNKIKRNAEFSHFHITSEDICDLSPSSNFVKEEEFNLFYPEEVEKQPLLDKLSQMIKEKNSKRIFIDGLTQLRFLSTDNYRFQQSIISLIKLISKNSATLLLVSESGETPDDDLQFICDGVINLAFDDTSRTLKVNKYRGADFKKGAHSFVLNNRGMIVYPNLSCGYRINKYQKEILSSGIPEIDKLLHGGIEKSTNTIITGPTGVGKTSLGLTFMKEAAGRGERSKIYMFEEDEEVLLERSKAINIPVDKMIAKGTLSIQNINPTEITPEIFSHIVKKDIEENKTDIVMIDSISSYNISFRDSQIKKSLLVNNLHVLSKYLTSNNVTVLMTNEITNITGDFKATDEGISYLADNIIFLRYLELKGEMCKAIGVLKKRLSNFETRLRQYKITQYGIEVGKPLVNLRGILSGAPEIITQERE